MSLTRLGVILQVFDHSLRKVLSSADALRFSAESRLGFYRLEVVRHSPGYQRLPANPVDDFPDGIANFSLGQLFFAHRKHIGRDCGWWSWPHVPQQDSRGDLISVWRSGLPRCSSRESEL